MFQFLLSSLLLNLTGAWARMFRHTRLFRRPSPQPTLLPQKDNDTERSRRIAAARTEYDYISIAEKLHISTHWDLKTIRKLPAHERYPVGILIPKLLVIAALRLRSRKKARLNSLQDLDGLYRVLGIPRIAKTWREDAEFVRQRLQGINPIWIKRCHHPEQLLDTGLDAGVYVQVRQAWRPEHPLYVVNYHALLEGIAPQPGSYLAPAIAFFEVRPDQQLYPLGIQLSDAAGSRWFYPDGSPGWTLAKMFFNNADVFVHEVLSHLLWTHLYPEKIWIAAARALSPKHPVWKLLAPHFQFTLQANHNSNAILLGENGIFADLFSAGRAGTIQLFEKGEQLWSFRQTVLPDLLALHEVGDLPDYHYRDDGMLVWAAVDNYIGQYLQLYYPNPDDLHGDTELAAWSQELADLFGAGKIPAFADRGALQLVLTSVLFNVIQHSFVGSVQYEYIAYPLAMPPNLLVPVPLRQEAVVEEDLVRALPDLDQIHTIIKATYAFSLQYSTLGDHLEAYHRDPAAVVVVRAFQDELKRVDRLIAERDRQRPKPYRISRPQAIANSVSA